MAFLPWDMLLVANWSSENWKAFGKKTEPVTKSDVFKISPRPHCCKKETSVILPWPPECP